jgi:hypothetical protein
MTGVMENYIKLRRDEETKFDKHDLCVVLVADGLDRINPKFLEFAKEKKLFD